jgi:hypothetical protein
VAIVRVCPEHGLILVEGEGDALICPRGWQEVTRWRVVNTETGLVVAEAGSAEEEGIEEMRRRTVVRTTSEAQPAAPRGPKVKVIDGASFAGSRNGQKLLVRLRHHTVISRWRVFWSQVDRKGAKAQGHFADAPTLEAGRAAFEEALKNATEAGWRRTLGRIHGGREIRLRQIPAP